MFWGHAWLRGQPDCAKPGSFSEEMWAQFSAFLVTSMWAVDPMITKNQEIEEGNYIQIYTQMFLFHICFVSHDLNLKCTQSLH